MTKFVNGQQAVVITVEYFETDYNTIISNVTISNVIISNVIISNVIISIVIISIVIISIVIIIILIKIFDTVSMYGSSWWYGLVVMLWSRSTKLLYAGPG